MTGDDGELLPAASFIEAAERSGMIQELDRWVVGQGPGAARRARARGRARSLSTSTSPAPRSPTSRSSSSSSATSTKATPTPRAAPSRSPRPRGSTTTTRPAASPTGSRVRLPGRDRRLQRRLRPPPLPRTAALRRDQDRRPLRPRHAAQRRRPAHRPGDRPDRPRPGQDDDRRVRPGRRDDEMLREYGVDMAQGFHLAGRSRSTRRWPPSGRACARAASSG